MKEKYFWATAAIIMLGIVYGAWLQIKDKERFILDNECAVIDKTESILIYNPNLGGSFTEIPAKTTYLCKDGREYVL